MSITKANVTEESLNKLPYGKLKETFEALGIPSVWKPGGKAKVMIEDALNKLSIIKELPEEVEEVDEAVKKAEAKQRKAAKVKADKAKAKLKLESDRLSAKLKGTKRYTKSELEAKVAQLKITYQKCVPGHKEHFAKKLNVFSDMLANQEFKKD